jgi:hypothetical protein
MARNGTGTYTLPAGNPVVAGTTISETWANGTLTDIATALTNSISADGQTVVVGDIPFNGFKIKGIADGTLTADAINKGQLDSKAASGTYTPVASAATGLTSVAALTGCYQKIDSVVQVAGAFSATAAAGRCYVSLTLPVASNLVGSDLWGAGVATDATNEYNYAANCRIDVAGDKAIVEFWAAVDGDVVVQVNFSYIVK